MLIFVVEAISEEELYKYTRNRWIFNESVQLSKRYLKFDLQQLLKAAVTAVADGGARYCTRVLKCREGLNNKAYLLTMDNGSEVFAKLPNSIAGPAFYTTASEVATREFLRNVLNIPTPRIISWSADQNNPVGAEYILEEKAPGKPLGSLWYQWPMKDRLKLISQIVEIERQLTSTKFTQSGCIYFKGDIPENMSIDCKLVSHVPLQSSELDRFRLGPLTSSGLWRGDRAGMNMNRGPYNKPLEFVEAMATNEKLFIKSHAHPRMNYHRSSTELELPEEILGLLDQYLQLAPAMVPPPGMDDTHSPTLWHPDLHLDNVFVDPDSKQITRIIDWQSAAVMPLYYHCGIPRMFKHPGIVSNGWALSEPPEDYDTLDENEKAKIDSARNSEACHKYYEVETKSSNPRHWAALQLENAEVRTEPSRLVVNVWEDRDVFFLRRALLEIMEQWPNLCPESGACPVSFNEQELAVHAAEEESMSNVGEILRLFRDNWGLPPNGMVDPAEFDQVRTAIMELRESFIESADDEAERELFARLWPYQDADR
ncbi:hypothetical protein OIDMADRAFT_204366 [Oidiodendron maius Zn]|uniref:Aminoglycoside phosphotransferase domain-containing protein n=1 Tax=Oidiodendron maius (strain Zn) TaxID=913774 RepID=A0A0C3GN51_OIDMZ|nr:hypothetical protein OIDMADRAFT_204366 [Oidiodendron maius Zn]